MATVTWNGNGGSTIGDLTDNGNWTGGSAPGNGDTAIVPFNATIDMTTNMAGLTSTLTDWIVERGCRIKIGDAGNELTVSVADLLYEGGSLEHGGEFWFKDGSGTTTRAIIRAGTPDTIVHLGGATITNVDVVRGNVTMDGDIGTVAELTVGHIGNIQGDVTMTLAPGILPIYTKIVQDGGRITNGATVTLLDIMDGDFTHHSASGISMTACNLNGGNVLYNSTGTITTLKTRRGEFRIVGPAMTLTNLFRFQGNGRLFLTRNANIHAITNEFDLRNSA